MKKCAIILALIMIVAVPAMAARSLTVKTIDHYASYVQDDAGNTVGVPFTVFQAYALDKGWGEPFAGFGTATCDLIKAVPGIFAIEPGDKWVNFVDPAATSVGGGYDLKNVILKKTVPAHIQCQPEFPAGVVIQQGTKAIRTWWPVLYEIPGTKFDLTVFYGTKVAYVDSASTPPASYSHQDAWHWMVDANLESMKAAIDVFTTIPWGTCQFPLISSMKTADALQAILDEIFAAKNQGTPEGDELAAQKLIEFEWYVTDRCISAIAPCVEGTPDLNGVVAKRGSAAWDGIAATFENPVCCKLLVDAEYVGKALNIWAVAK